jgi:hypothetical protein
MRELSRKNAISAVIGGALLIAALGACRPKSPETPPAPAPPPPETVAIPEVTISGPAGTAATPAMPADVAAATQADDATKEQGPELASMSLASTTAKLGVPVDLRYSFDGAVEVGRPVTLHIAAVPRAAGSNLSVTIKEEPGLQASAAPITAQKAGAGTAYRRQLSVMRLAGGPAELRVLVTMDMPIGQAHSWFSVPLAPPVNANGKAALTTQ